MSLLGYWKSHPQYWIAIKNRERIDQEITELFYNCPFDKLDWIEKVIYLDQFCRHFQRHLRTNLDENAIILQRRQAAEIVLQNEKYLSELEEVELIFCLMPFKHLKYYFYIFNTIHGKWLKEHKVKDYFHLNKFYNDTYKKAYTIENVYKDIKSVHSTDIPFDPVKICEYYSTDYNDKIDDIYLDYFPDMLEIDNPIISLSGGVDSMVLLYYYKLAGSNPVAVHIIYGNRKESEDEYRFIVEYCNNLKVKLFVYRIQWLKRDLVEREFYENITREIRFMVYKSVGGDNCNVVLGHILDDVVENIWTNFATCKHIENLKKMGLYDRQKNINIYRPFLSTSKTKILDLAKLIGIPYLLNTTPSWSNRGKYRENFYKAVRQQYGDGVDNSIIRFSEMVTSQFRLINELLYKPILDSFEKFEGEWFNITPAMNNNVELIHWDQLLEQIFHRKMGVAKPSIHSVRNFYERVTNFKTNIQSKIQIQLKKDVLAVIVKEENKVYLKLAIL